MTTDLDVRHNYADLGDVMLHYVVAGEGPPVVLLHGWPQTWWEWRHIIPILAKKYTVIAPDLRGLGDSSRPIDGYDKMTVANDIWKLVSDELGYSSFLLVGHDWGGANGVCPSRFSSPSGREISYSRCSCSRLWR